MSSKLSTIALSVHYQCCPRKVANDEVPDMFSESDGQAMSLSKAHQSDEAPRPDAPSSAHSAEPELSQHSPGASISKPVGGVTSRKFSSELSEEPSLDGVRDASEGKARGPSGRYLPKEDPPVLSPRSRKNGKKRRERARMVKVKEAEKREFIRYG
jgi:hypothetical protein